MTQTVCDDDNVLFYAFNGYLISPVLLHELWPNIQPDRNLHAINGVVTEWLQPAPLFPSSRSRLARTRILHEKTCRLSHSQRQFISGCRLNLFPISGNMMFHQRMGFVSRETYSKRFRNFAIWMNGLDRYRFYINTPFPSNKLPQLSNNWRAFRYRLMDFLRDPRTRHNYQVMPCCYFPRELNIP